MLVSIHAPTKGATYIEEILPNDTVVSIHAPTKGATHVDIHLNCIVGFQSTLPRRERRQGIKLGVRPVCFNPRSHEGSDDYNTVLRRVVKVSIHAPTKGATPSVRWLLILLFVSIHAPTKGATFHLSAVTADMSCFNPRSHEGSDRHRPTSKINGMLFQSTLPRRERRRFWICFHSHTSCFNPRSHEGSDYVSGLHNHAGKVSIHAPTKGAT